jgi:hypothetical protein
MRAHTTLALLVACGLAIAIAATGQAGQLAISPGGTISAVSLGNLTFRSPLASITCPLTLTGSFGTLTADYGELGTVTSVRGTEGCRGGTVRAEGLPWLVAGEAALGTPPRLTGLGETLYNADVLIGVNFFGIDVRCDYLGAVPTLGPLTGENPYRTGLLTIQTAGQSWELDSSLDRSGMCPAGREVSVTGGLSATSETLTRNDFVLTSSPVSPIRFGGRSGSVDISLTNASGVDQRIRAIFIVGNSNYFRVAPGSCAGNPKVLGPTEVCTVTATYTNPGGRANIVRYAQLRLTGDPNESWLGGGILRSL